MSFIGMELRRTKAKPRRTKAHDGPNQGNISSFIIRYRYLANSKLHNLQKFDVSKLSNSLSDLDSSISGAYEDQCRCGCFEALESRSAEMRLVRLWGARF
jgi:hypothetical protein